MLNANPTSLNAMIASGARNIRLDPGHYGQVTIRADAAPMLSISGTGAGTVLDAVVIQGQPLGFSLSNVRVLGGGVQSVDGVPSVTLSNVTVEGVDGVGFNFTGYDTQPAHDVTLSGCRAKDCRIGLMIGQCIRWRVYDFWADRCQHPTNPSDPSCHGVYLNDDVTIAGDVHGMLITRCGGTSFRGTGSRAYDCIAYQCGGSMAGGRNCELMERFTSIDSGAIEVGSQVCCLVDEAWGSIQVKNTCRSPWLQLVNPTFPPGGGTYGGEIYPMPDQDVPGRVGTMTVRGETYAQSDPTGGRTPETFCRDLLGGTASLDDLWGRSFKVSDLNKYLRGVA